MIFTHRTAVAALLAVTTLALGPAVASAQHSQLAPPQAETKSLQGGDNSAWSDNPNMHAFYDLTVATLGKGTANIDFPAYQQKSYALFRAFGTSMGWKPEAMVDHLKDIPRQLVGIVKDDPKVLDNYKNFTLALMGPP
jgi:hypothetical protein